MEKSLKIIRSTLEEIETEEGVVETSIKMMEIITNEEEQLNEEKSENDIQSINNLPSTHTEVETPNVIDCQNQHCNEPEKPLYQILEEKEVEVFDDEGTSAFDTNSTEVSIATITCIQQPKHNNFPKRGPGTYQDQGSKDHDH